MPTTDSNRGATDTADTQPVFSRDQLAARAGNSAELMRELVELFLGVQPRDLLALRNAVDARQFPVAKRLAHKVAGSFASLSMDRLAAQSLALEQLAAGGKGPRIAEALAILEGDFERARAELVVLLGELAAS